MPRPALRSRSWRRIKKKTPGGKPVIHYFRKKPKQAKCAICKKPLKGVPKGRPIDLKKLTKSKKRPNRKFGGYLCSPCSRKEIKKELFKKV